VLISGARRLAATPRIEQVFALTTTCEAAISIRSVSQTDSAAPFISPRKNELSRAVCK